MSRPLPQTANASTSCDGSDVCRSVLEKTDQLWLAHSVAWLVTTGLLILFIVIAAWIVSRAIKRYVPRVVDGVLSRADRERLDEEAGSRSPNLLDPDPTDPERAPAQHDDDPAETSLPPDHLILDELDLTEEQRLASSIRHERRRQRANTLAEVGGEVVAGIVWFVALLMILSELGLDLAPLLAGAGVAGIALGFGAQQLVRDFLSGVFIIFEDQYGVGDVVSIGELTGTVERVSLRITKLRDIDGTAWFIPNGELKAVGNHSQLWARAVLDIDVSYDSDTDEASAILKRVADELWRDRVANCTILSEPELWGVQHFGADAITIRLVVRTEPNEQWATARELRRRIKPALDAAGIEIPFAQRTVWLRDDRAHDAAD